jgi:hypothetical protein
MGVLLNRVARAKTIAMRLLHNTHTILLLIAAMGVVSVPVVAADTLTVDGGWQYFTWPTTAVPTVSVGTVIAEYTLGTTGSISNVTELRITDAYTNGDMFRVHVSGYSTCTKTNVDFTVMTAPVETSQYWYEIWNDKDGPWKFDGWFSGLSVSLDPGSYTVTVALAQSSLDGTTGAAVNRGKAYIRAATNGVTMTCPTFTTKAVERLAPLGVRPASATTRRDPTGASDSGEQLVKENKQ